MCGSEKVQTEGMLLCEREKHCMMRDLRVFHNSKTHCTEATFRNSSLICICESIWGIGLLPLQIALPNDMLYFHLNLEVNALISCKNKEKVPSGNVHIRASALKIW